MACINIEQSNLSVNPPCSGIKVEKSLIFKALLSPEPKNPPKGAMKLAKRLIIAVWISN